jgi:hemerythrin-like metal-binding protein/diguanylate cyclase (GGDEF)-like protein
MQKAGAAANLSLEILPWNDAFNTGIKVIDTQHQQLVAMLNALARHVAVGHDDTPLGVLLQSLLDYADYHFQSEEQLWEKFIPEAEMVDKHKQTHRAFFDTIQTLSQENNADTGDQVVQRLFEFLTRWLASHILESDRRMALIAMDILQNDVSFAEAQQRAAKAMGGVIQVLMQAIIDVYAQLSSTSVLLMREQAQREAAEAELLRLQAQRMQDALERQASDHQAHLAFLAYHDALTGTYNRNGLLHELHNLLAKRIPLAVISLDLDDFQRINRQIGVESADRYLSGLATRMRQGLGTQGTLARIAGDEFLVLVRQAERLESTLALLQQIASHSEIYEGVGVNTSFCAGVSRFPQTHSVDADTLLRQADYALYRAKQQGQQQIEYFDENEERWQRDRHEQRERLRKGLQQGEFTLHYQPKVNLATGQLAGLEALVRWQHPELGLRHPGQFLPIIESHPLNLTLGEWVLEAALTQLEQWQEKGFDTHVSVNIDSRQLQAVDFPQRLGELLLRHPRLQASQLDLEILETVALDQVDAAIANIAACRKLGVTFSLDDFGTGYSSLAYLKKLPVDTLKIDQSFVQEIVAENRPQAMLSAIIGLSRAFGMQVLAEGIETEDQGLHLLQLGCMHGQGYAIARPMPAEHIEEWCKNWQPPARWSSTGV